MKNMMKWMMLAMVLGAMGVAGCRHTPPPPPEDRGARTHAHKANPHRQSPQRHHRLPAGPEAERDRRPAPPPAR